MDYKQLLKEINEVLLTEAYYNLQADVDYIYNEAFRFPMSQIINNGLDKNEILSKIRLYQVMIESSELPSNLAKEASDASPVTIYCNYNKSDSKNFYSISRGLIVLNFVNEQGDVIISSENKMKQTIYHELTHWIHNYKTDGKNSSNWMKHSDRKSKGEDYTNYLNKGFFKKLDVGQKKLEVQKKKFEQLMKSVNTKEEKDFYSNKIDDIVDKMAFLYDKEQEYYEDRIQGLGIKTNYSFGGETRVGYIKSSNEMESQFSEFVSHHNNISKKDWNNLTFDELLNQTQLSHYKRILIKSDKRNNRKDYTLWKRKHLKRLHREGLLGKNMVNN